MVKVCFRATVRGYSEDNLPHLKAIDVVGREFVSSSTRNRNKIIMGKIFNKFHDGDIIELTMKTLKSGAVV